MITPGSFVLVTPKGPRLIHGRSHFGIPGIYLTWPPGHPQENDALGLWSGQHTAAIDWA